MELESDQAVQGALGFTFVRDIDSLLAIDKLLKVVSFGNDHVIIPIAFLETPFNFSGTAYRADDLLFVVIAPNDLLSA